MVAGDAISLGVFASAGILLADAVVERGGCPGTSPSSCHAPDLAYLPLMETNASSDAHRRPAGPSSSNARDAELQAQRADSSRGAFIDATLGGHILDVA